MEKISRDNLHAEETTIDALTALSAEELPAFADIMATEDAVQATHAWGPETRSLVHALILGYALRVEHERLAVTR